MHRLAQSQPGRWGGGRKGQTARRCPAWARDCRGRCGSGAECARAGQEGRSRNANCRRSESSTVRGSVGSQRDRRPHDEGAPSGGRSMKGKEPVQEFFSIGDVCTLTDLKPHVLRYWESQFKFLHPAKNRSGNRVYQRREIELIMLVKHLLYTEKYTIEGARQKIEQYRRPGELKPEARRALATQTEKDLRRELKSIRSILDGTAAPNVGAR